MTGLVLWRLMRLYEPYGAAANPFNSDMGILVGMARDGCWSPYAWYFYGQDRIGAWPYWSLGSVGHALGFSVNAGLLHAGTFAALVASVAAVLNAAALPVLPGLATFALLAMAGDARMAPYLFDLCHPCAWPLVALLLFAAVVARLARGGGGRAALAAFVPCLGVAALGIWASRNLVVLFALPLAFAIWRRGAGARGPGPVAWAVPLAAAVLAIVAENQLRVGQLAYAEANGLPVFETPVYFEVVWFDYDLKVMLRQFLGTATIGMLAGCVVAMWAQRDRAPAALPFALLVLAALNIALVSFSGWPRMNRYHPRYLSLSYALVALALAAALAPLLARPARFALLLLGLAAPLPLGENPETAQLRRHARLIERAFPGAPLVGTHWGTYVYAALQDEHPVVPVPLEGRRSCTPWTDASLAHAKHALVSQLATKPTGEQVHVRGRELVLEKREAIAGVPVALYRVVR